MPLMLCKSCRKPNLKYETNELCEACLYNLEKTKPKPALSVQVGGNHYKDMKIQPIEFTMKNNLNFCQGNVIKYVTRYKHKNGIEDLKKAKHYIDLIIDLEYGEEGKQNESRNI